MRNGRVMGGAPSSRVSGAKAIPKRKRPDGVSRPADPSLSVVGLENSGADRAGPGAPGAVGVVILVGDHRDPVAEGMAAVVVGGAPVVAAVDLAGADLVDLGSAVVLSRYLCQGPRRRLYIRSK